MKLIDKMEEHQRLFELEDSLIDHRFKNLLSEVNPGDAKKIKLECGNFTNSSGLLSSSRYSLVTKWPQQKYITKIFNFIETYVDIPRNIKEMVLHETELYDKATGAQFIAGYDEREEDVRLKLGLNVDSPENFELFTKGTMAPLGYDFLGPESRFALGFDFCLNKSSKETRIVPKFYFMNAPLRTYETYRKVYEKYFDSKTIEMIRQSIAIFVSTRDNSPSLHIAFKPRDMPTFLSEAPVDLGLAHRLEEEYNSIGRRMWSIALLESEIRANNIKSVNTYCVY